MAKKKTASRTSPKNSKRGCLCDDNTYHRDCCDGSLQAQGIGSDKRLVDDTRNRTIIERNLNS